MDDFQFIDLGPLPVFRRKVKMLNARSEDREFRMRALKGVGKGFWVFEEEDAETVFGGVLHVTAGHVYAISEDVYQFVASALRRARC